VPFFAARHNRLYVVTIFLRTCAGFDREVQLYTLGTTFLSPIERAADPTSVYLDWHIWGPEGTRMMLHPSSSLETWESEVYGTRYVSTRQSPGSHTEFVYIYDFNQSGLKWSRKSSQSKGAGSGMDITIQDFMSGKRNVTPSCLDVTTPTKIVDNEIFQDEVETKLGYNIKRWEIPGRPRVQSAMCSEDGLVFVVSELLVVENGDGRAYEIFCHTA
jgi:hypothetical protein